MDTLQPEQSERSSRLLWVVVLVSLVTTLFLATLPEKLWVFSDTAHYMSMARLIQAGEGIQTDLIYYSEQAVAGTVPAPQTVFPPGYSFAVAGVSSFTGANHHVVGKWLCLASYTCIAPLIFLIGQSIRMRPALSAFAAILWLPLVAAWMPTWCYSSDILFLLLTLSSVLCFVRAEDRPAGLLAAGVFAGLAVTVRYAGVFLGFVYGVIFLLRHRTNLPRSVRDGCLAIGPALTATLIMFARNRALVGHWKGGNKYAGNDLSYVLKLFYYSVCEYTGFSKTELLEGKLFCIAQVVFLIGLCAMLTGLLVRHVRNLPSQIAGRMGVVLLYGPVSIGLLIFLHVRTSSGMSPRLFLPTVPCLLLTFAAMYQTVLERYQRFRFVTFGFVVCGMFGVLYGQSRCMADFRVSARRGLANAFDSERTDRTKPNTAGLPTGKL